MSTDTPLPEALALAERVLRETTIARGSTLGHECADVVSRARFALETQARTDDDSLTESAIERLHREMDAKDARIEELEAAVNDLMALLPPERWDLIRPPTRDIIRQINDREDSDHE